MARIAVTNKGTGMLRNISASRLILNSVFLISILTLVLNVEINRGLHGSGWLYAYSLILCVVAALLTEIVRVRKQQYGGWLLVLVVLAALYIVQTGAHGSSVSEIARNTAVMVTANGETITHDADHLREVYIVLATAAFTLYGLFFVAVKRITMRNALRLVSISEGFGLVFLFAIPALALGTTPWWRLGLMFALNAYSLALFAREMAPALTDYAVDSPGTVAFWQDWTSQRRGYSLIIFSSLCILALWPVLGEITLVITLSYILYSSTRSATFLFISTEIQIDKLNYDAILRSLFMIRVSPQIERDVADIRRARYASWFARSPASKHVLFRFANQPRKNIRTVYFQFRNRRED